jgi:hypothetical protein
MTLLLLLAAALAALWFGQRWLIYFPLDQPPPPHTLGLRDADAVLIHTEDELTLHAWFVPPAAPPTGQTVVVFNGNGGHRGLRAPLAEALATLGAAVLLVDYRGYGGNPGLPSERGLATDARAAFTYVTSRSDVDPARLVYFGESLGAAVATRLAVERPPSALILRSPFTSLADIGQLHYPLLPVRWLLRDRYPVADLIGRVQSPILVIAGTGDRIVPFDNSEEVFEAAPEPKWMAAIENAHHNDQRLLDGRDMLAAIARFLTGVRQ